MLKKKPQIVPRSNVDAGVCPMCSNTHALRQVREDYNPGVEAVFCNKCGNVSVHELQAAEHRKEAGMPP